MERRTYLKPTDFDWKIAKHVGRTESGAMRGHSIPVVLATEVSAYDSGSTGQRGFVKVIDLQTGAVIRSELGSFGGPNAFTSSPSAVDDPKAPPIQVTVTTAVLLGSEGSRYGVTVYLHPHTIATDVVRRMQALADQGIAACTHEDCQCSEEMRATCAPPALDLRARQILAIHRGIKAGPYRREELSRARVRTEEIEALITGGYLSRSKVGAITLTLSGRNASEGISVY